MDRKTVDDVLIQKKPHVVTREALRSGAAIAALLCILCGAAFTRLAFLSADPPWWMQGAFISDEGWWADAARGKILFNNHYADDFGTAFLITPGYTWTLEAVYRLFGVGTAQTRLPEALASIITISLVAGLLWRTAGRREALAAALLLTLSPFYWSYGRIGLQEAMQTMFVAGSFALWFISAHYRWAAAAAGAAMGLGIVLKPNSIDLGLFPVLLAAIAGYVVQAAGLDPAACARLRRNTLQRAALAAMGGVTVLGACFIFHVLPNWPAFKAMALAESGAPEARLSHRIKFLGMFLMSMESRDGVNTPILWNPARWSPALAVAFWFFVLSLMMRLRAGVRHLLRSFDVLEAMALVWALGVLCNVGLAYYQPDRRYVMMFPPLAILGALFWGRTLRAAVTFTRYRLPEARGRLYSCCLWFILTLPAMVLLKPPLTALIMDLATHVKIGRDAGLDYTAAGTVFMLGWLPAVVFAALRWPGTAETFGLVMLRRPVILTVPALFLALEAGIIGLQFARQQSTMTAQQAELAPLLRPDSIVMGHTATTLLMPLPLRTVRRVSKYEYAPPHNPDVWDRLRPRYIIEMTQRNYEPAPPLYDDLIARGKYKRVRNIEIGPWHNGKPRYLFELYELPF